VAGKLAAAKAVLGAAPQSVGFTVLAGINAIELSRPREALQILRQFKGERAPLSPQQRNVYWSFVGYAYHELGEFDNELQAARLLDDTNNVERARALAGRGDSASARRVAEQWLQQPEDADPLLERVECVALELRAHGAPGTAAVLLEATANARGPQAADRSGYEPCLWNLFSSHYYVGRLDEAKAAYARKAAEDSGDVRARAALAAIAARQGEQAEVDRHQAWLAAHPGGVSDLALARVAALQGRREDAVRLLRRAMDTELERHFLHIDPDFESLRNYSPYRELLRPKG
jgi:hypothetical protein